MPKKYNKDSWGLTFIHFHDKGYAEDKVKALDGHVYDG